MIVDATNTNLHNKLFNFYHDKIIVLIKKSLNEANYVGKSKSHIIVLSYYRIIFTYLVNYYSDIQDSSLTQNILETKEFKNYFYKLSIPLYIEQDPDSNDLDGFLCGINFMEIEIDLIIEPNTKVCKNFIIPYKVPDISKVCIILKRNCTCRPIKKQNKILLDFVVENCTNVKI